MGDSAPLPWTIERITKSHDRATFDCGKPALNEFLQKHARQSQDLGIATTFAAVTAGQPKVHGYYTLRAGSVDIAALPPQDVKRLPRYPVPVVHLARLAVDRSVQGRGLGEFLLLDSFRRACESVRSGVAAFAMEVFAIDDEARRFYLKYDFAEMLDDKLHLYLSMKKIAALQL